MDTNNEHPLRVLREQLNLSIDDLAEVCGISPRTILRAEQGESLYPGSRRQICNYLQRSPEELGLLPRPSAQKGQPTSLFRGALLSTGIDEMKRRELLRLLGIASSMLVLPFDLVDLDWERLSDALTHPSHLNDAVLEDCSTINRQFWRNYRAAVNKGAVLDDTLLHLQRLTYLLRNSHMATHHQQLCILVSDLSQLLGEVCFDANLYNDAIQCYTFAASAAKEANAYDLWACAFTRQAFIPIYDRQFREALPILQVAGQIALRGDSELSTRHWVAAVSAEAHAGIGDLDACQNALDFAEKVRSLKNDSVNGAWLRFDGARLPEERGACFVKLSQPDLAESALIQALEGQPEPTRRRGMILNDLALVAIQRGNIELACSYGSEVVTIAHQGASGVLKKGLQTLQTQLKPFARANTVKSLNEQVKPLFIVPT